MKKKNEINWELERKSFAVFPEKAYFAFSATSPLRKEVYQVFHQAIEKLYLEGDFDWSIMFKKIEEGKEILAEIIDASNEASQVMFGGSTSYLMNLLASLCKSREKRRKILVYRNEYPSTYIPWIYQGFECCWLDSLKTDELKEVLSNEKEFAVCLLSSVQYLDGQRANLSEWGQILDKSQIPFIVNATQGLGTFPLSVKSENISAVVASSYKRLSAGMGASILYVKESFIDGGKWPFAGPLSYEGPSLGGSFKKLKKGASAIELGAPSFPNLLALAESLKHIQRIGVSNISDRVSFLYLLLKELLIKKGFASYFLAEEDRGTNIMALKLPHVDEVQKFLFDKKIITNVRGGVLRISLNYCNNEEDIMRLINSLELCAANFGFDFGNRI